MSDKPPIIVTISDYERLEQLLAMPKYRNLPGADALRNELDRATIVESADIPPDVITMNSTVRFIDDTTKDQYEMTLVYPDATDGANKVSIMAPVGSALLGMSVGQSIPWQVPGRQKLQLRVLEILAQPEISR